MWYRPLLASDRTEGTQKGKTNSWRPCCKGSPQYTKLMTSRDAWFSAAAVHVVKKSALVRTLDSKIVMNVERRQKSAPKIRPSRESTQPPATHLLRHARAPTHPPEHSRLWRPSERYPELDPHFPNVPPLQSRAGSPIGVAVCRDAQDHWYSLFNPRVPNRPKSVANRHRPTQGPREPTSVRWCSGATSPCGDESAAPGRGVFLSGPADGKGGSDASEDCLVHGWQAMVRARVHTWVRPQLSSKHGKRTRGALCSTKQSTRENAVNQEWSPQCSQHTRLQYGSSEER